MKKYDYLIVGSGLYGATLANLLSKNGKKVLVIDKRSHVAGNIYTENIDGIDVHVYGAHIFHTSDEEVWNYINKFSEFNGFINYVIANYNGVFYHLPFNMNTFKEIFGVTTPEEAKAKINEEIAKEGIKEPKNLEEQAISLVGRTIYEKLIKGYTEKQWGKKCNELPSFIIKRLPLRFEYNNNYFNDKYQGIPLVGYTKLIENMLEGIEVRLDTDFLEHKELRNLAKYTVYTGAIDEFYDYKFGELEFRSLRFDIQRINKEYYQNNCVINYTDSETKFTRIIEHKYFLDQHTKTTVITKEYPATYKKGMERYYTMNDEKNLTLLAKYQNEASKEKDLIFGGRLGAYKYYDMDDTIRAAIDKTKELLENE